MEYREITVTLPNGQSSTLSDVLSEMIGPLTGELHVKVIWGGRNHTPDEIAFRER